MLTTAEQWITGGQTEQCHTPWRKGCGQLLSSFHERSFSDFHLQWLVVSNTHTQPNAHTGLHSCHTLPQTLTHPPYTHCSHIYPPSHIHAHQVLWLICSFLYHHTNDADSQFCRVEVVGHHGNNTGLSQRRDLPVLLPTQTYSGDFNNISYCH